MDEQTMNIGDASDSGEQRQGGENVQQDTQGATPNADSHRGGEPSSVPYARFQEVNARRKAAEDTLAGIVNELCEDVPESMRDLIPNLPPADKIRWLREARQKGLFNPPAPTSSPDSKRPTAKPSEDLSTLSPVAMMARGYK